MKWARKNPVWALFLFAALALILFCFVKGAHAQGYQSIPNFGTGGAIIPDNPTGAGYYFRKAINNKLNGTDTITPQLVHLNFYQLPATATNGQLYYVNDGIAGSPCQGGGTGAIAYGVGGQWFCTGTAAPAGALNPLD